MTQMTHRERVLAALNHQNPDRIPLDLGSHANGSIHIIAYEKLKKELGISKPTRLLHRWMQIAEIDEEVLQQFDIDIRRLPYGEPVHNKERDLDEKRYIDAWGVTRCKPEGCQYYELESSPLSGEITISDIARFSWPDPVDPGICTGLRERAMRLKSQTDYAISMKLPSPFVHTSQFLRGFTDWFMDFAANPDLITALMDAILEINLATVQMLLGEVGDLIDIVSMADDLGTQTGLILSPTMYRKYIKPRHQKYFETIHGLSKARVLFHSCGSIWQILDDLAEIGVDAINPVQVSAANMETARLKTRIGDRLTFWGGVESQHILPNGSPEEVQEEVRRRIADLGSGGGYVLSAVHNIQPDVPPENICALYQAGLKYGFYPLSNL